MATKDYSKLDLKGDMAPIVLEFNSPHEYVRHCETLDLDPYCDSPWWCGASSKADAIAKFHAGDSEGAKQAQELIDKLESEGIISSGAVALGPSVIGFTPLVPAYLLGHPEQMLARVEAPSMMAPLRVYVGLGGGGDVTVEDLRKRGVVLMALVLALAPIRPVELFAYNLSKNKHQPTVQVIRLETRPLDLEQVSWVLSSATMHRVFGFATTDHACRKKIEEFRSIPYQACEKTQLAVLRVALEEQGTDTLIIPRLQLNQNDEMIRRPVKWLQKRIADHTVQLA